MRIVIASHFLCSSSENPQRYDASVHRDCEDNDMEFWRHCETSVEQRTTYQIYKMVVLAFLFIFLTIRPNFKFQQPH